MEMDQATRVVVISPGRYPGISKPHVVAETYFAFADGQEWGDGIALSAEEALLDPEYQEAVLAWRSGDDSERQREEARILVSIEAGEIVDDEPTDDE